MYDNTKPEFNAAQRGHQNMLETHYAQLWAMSIAGLRFPIATAVAGLVWSVGRILYAVGYSAAAPNNRVYGYGLSTLSFLATVGMAGTVAAQLLGWL